MCRTLITLLTLLSFTACTTMQAMPDVQPAALREQLKPGDHVQLQLASGKSWDVRVDQLTDDALIGTSAGQRYRFPYATIMAAQKRVTKEGSTLWVVLGAAVVVGLIIAGSGGGGGDGGGGSGY